MHRASDRTWKESFVEAVRRHEQVMDELEKNLPRWIRLVFLPGFLVFIIMQLIRKRYRSRYYSVLSRWIEGVRLSYIDRLTLPCNVEHSRWILRFAKFEIVAIYLMIIFISIFVYFILTSIIIRIVFY